MMNNNKVSEYLASFEDSRMTIENFPLEINEGTKRMIEKYKNNAIEKRNDTLYSLIEEYRADLDTVREILINKMNQMLPEEPSTDIAIHRNTLDLLKKVIYYNNKYNDVYDKTNFERIIYNIDDIENYDLKESNNILLNIVNKFDNASISLKTDDFNYSPYTREYMKVFLEKKEKDDFDDSMSSLFAELYWTCPNLLTHLKLNIRYLIMANEKKLLNFCENCRKNLFKQSSTDVQNYYQTFSDTRELLDDLIKKDPYLNLHKFVNGDFNIDNYLKSSITRNDVFNKYVIEDDFNDYSIDSKNKFYDEIYNLGNSIIELQNYKLFECVVMDVVDRYKSKDKNKGMYNLKLKQINKLEKERIKKIKKYMSLSKRKENSKQIEQKKTLMMAINKDIEALNTLYTELDDARINEKIATFINDNSSIYDALALAGSFYGYLKSIIIKNFSLTSMKEVNDYMEKYEEFLYNPNVMILKKLNLFNDCDIEFMIIQKCKLFGINIDSNVLENAESILKDIEMILTIRDIESSTLSLEDIKFICEVKKLD